MRAPCRERRVTVVLDEAIATGEMVNFHPMRNERTVAIAARDLVRFLEACGHAVVVVGVPERG